ncbi:MAG TPA: hypothetical protein GXZ30_07965 [Propionibacterium sp.]|jgi:sn-glycerol 3-phosphate transport system substrate-binding protein|nr:hypothetical protein [Propionibacterium sp.]
MFSPKKRSFRMRLGAAVAGLTAALMLAACGGGTGAAGDDDQVAIDFYYPIEVGGPLESVIDGYIEQFHDQQRQHPSHTGLFRQL